MNNVVRFKVKLKYKTSQNQWVIEPGKIMFTNYFQALSNAKSQASSKSGELHIYNGDGKIKEILKFY